MVWVMLYGNLTYTTANFPPGWKDWKMELNGSDNGEDGSMYLSPFNKSYVQWKKSTIGWLMSEYPFDGVELAEPYFPGWEAIPKGPYGDVGPNAQKAFKEAYGLEMPNFSNPEADNYYKKQPDIYNKWVEFRVKGVNNYLDEIINGEGGVRDVRPDALVATWSLGIDAGPKSVELLREYQGLDAAAMVKSVEPDIHFIQTHWPDWLKSESDLPPDYMKNYGSFFKEIRDVAPELPIGLQADIGSRRGMIKSQTWFDKFQKEAKKYGYSTTTAYEYHIGGYMYDKA